MAKGKPDETHRLSVKLPEHELELLRKSLSAEVYQLEALEREKQALVAAMKSKIDAAKERILSINIETETGSGIRDVICKWRTEHSDKGREWVLRRQDTSEMVAVAPLTAADSQEELFSH
jgi:hypothetical protein